MRVLPIAVMALLVSACAVQPARPPVADPSAAFAERRSTLSGVDTWRVSGRVGVKSGRRGGQATVIWQRAGDAHEVRLWGPLGSGRMMLEQQGGSAVLRDGTETVVRGTRAEEVLYRAVGWWIPFTEMQHWILGLPAPDGDSSWELDAWGRLSSLEQAGWSVEFLDYSAQPVGGAKYDLPRRVFVSALPGTVPDELLRSPDVGDRDATPGGEAPRFEVRLVVREWRAGE